MDEQGVVTQIRVQTKTFHEKFFNDLTKKENPLEFHEAVYATMLDIERAIDVFSLIVSKKIIKSYREGDLIGLSNRMAQMVDILGKVEKILYEKGNTYQGGKLREFINRSVLLKIGVLGG